jgi:hypothetical protein
MSRSRQRRATGPGPGSDALLFSCSLMYLGGFVLIWRSFCGSGCTPPPWRAKKNVNIRRSKLIWHSESGTRRNWSTMAPTTWTWNCACRLTTLTWYTCTVVIHTVCRKEWIFGILIKVPALLLCLTLQDEEKKESVNDETIMDIDKADSGNPLAATDYVEELYNFYRETEVIINP